MRQWVAAGCPTDEDGDIYIPGIANHWFWFHSALADTLEELLKDYDAYRAELAAVKAAR